MFPEIYTMKGSRLDKLKLIEDYDWNHQSEGKKGLGT